MTTHLTIPPARCWDRIEEILDEQDCKRKYTDKLITDTLRKSANIKHANYFVATITGVSLLAFIMIKYTSAFKNN